MKKLLSHPKVDQKGDRFEVWTEGVPKVELRRVVQLTPQGWGGVPGGTVRRRVKEDPKMALFHRPIK